MVVPPLKEISRACASVDSTGRSIARTPGMTKRQSATAAGERRFQRVRGQIPTCTALENRSPDGLQGRRLRRAGRTHGNVAGDGQRRQIGGGARRILEEALLGHVVVGHGGWGRGR